MSKLLSFEQVEIEAKKRNVTIAKHRGYEFSLKELNAELDEKVYQAWKKKILAAWKANDIREIAYRKKYGYTGYKPIMERVCAKEESLRKQYASYVANRADEASIKLTEGQSSYSCAINEFGGFPGRKHKLDKHWDLLLAFYVNSTRFHYLKCATPVKSSYAGVRAGLKKVGFELRAKEKSNHGKYFVEVWEFIKPMKKEKKVKK